MDDRLRAAAVQVGHPAGAVEAEPHRLSRAQRPPLRAAPGEVTRTQQKGTEECWRTFYLLKAGQGETPSSVNQWNDCIDEVFVEPLATIQKRCVP